VKAPRVLILPEFPKSETSHERLDHIEFTKSTWESLGKDTMIPVEAEM
jgi:hypothetical protein